MKLQDQVCRLDLAKRLKKLGVRQESYFAWYLYPVQDDGDALTVLRRQTGIEKIRCNDWVAAFTVAELGSELGRASTFDFQKAYMEVMDLDEDQFFALQAMHNVMTQPDIPAQMLIYLLESSLIKV